MNCEQKTAIDAAIKGHNLLLLGKAGTGKSFTVKQITELLRSEGKSVKITCSTGIACQVYDDASTVHQFLGLLDGRFDPKDIASIIRNNVKYQYVLDNLKKLDTLIIDECSMISARTFESIIRVCELKETNKFLGGIQLILVGDFMQLPPVGNSLYYDPGSFCFENSEFRKAFTHKVVLKHVMRQSESEFIDVLHDVSYGRISEKTEQFILKLNRNVPDFDSCTTKLFSTNDRVDDYNREKLISFPGEMFESVSKDEGKVSALSNIQAPKILWLKIGCPVIIIRNITSKIVNGSRGTLRKIEDTDLLVEFPDTSTVRIQKHKFSVYSPRENKDIATREQYPLKPAFALTIHKAQGMTLDRVDLDCRDIFRCGQLGVAMSRAVTSDGLRVINYHPRYVIPPPTVVMEFMEEESQPLLTDMTCCRKSIGPLVESHSVAEKSSELSTQQLDDVEYQPGVDEEDELDDEFNSVIESLILEEENAVEFEIPEDFKIDSVLQNMKFKHEITPAHTVHNEIVSNIDKDKLTIFVKKVFLKLASFVVNLTGSKNSHKIPEKNIAQFYSVIHQYTTGAEFKLICLSLFKDLTENHMIVCYNIVEAVRLFYIKQKFDLLQIAGGDSEKRQVTNHSRARIRYVAGYCIASLRKKYSRLKKNNTFSKSRNGQNSYEQAKQNMDIINVLQEDENYIKVNTNEPDSLVDVERRQYTMKKLTNVNDELFNFFVTLTEKCLLLLIHENLKLYGKDLFKHCLKQICTDIVLYEKFVAVVVKSKCDITNSRFDYDMNVDDLLTDMVQMSSHVCIVYDEICEKYLMVFLAQFRKDIKSSLKVKKTMAHRKQIKVTASKNQEPKSKKTKSVPQKSSKSSKSSTSCDTDKPDSPQASSSYEQASQLDVTSMELDSDLCQSCFKDKNEEWIQCDSCNGWFHRNCAGLRNANQWKHFIKDGVIWLCKTCN